MKEKNLEKIHELIARWDVPLQLLLTMEESAELSVICSKVLRGFRVPREQIVDNVADVYVMLQTMCMLYGITEEEIDSIASEKLDSALAVPVNPNGNQEGLNPDDSITSSTEESVKSSTEEN